MLSNLGRRKGESSMNQSLSKLSERLRNNSSTSSVGGANGSKLKLKFKPIAAPGTKTSSAAATGEAQGVARRDRNSRAGFLKTSQTTEPHKDKGVAQGLTLTQQKKVPN